MSHSLDVIRSSLESIRRSAGDTTYSPKLEYLHVEKLTVNIHLAPRNGHAYALGYNHNEGDQNLGDILGRVTPIMCKLMKSFRRRRSSTGTKSSFVASITALTIKCSWP
jgi:hypothetical protein